MRELLQSLQVAKLFSNEIWPKVKAALVQKHSTLSSLSETPTHRRRRGAASPPARSRAALRVTRLAAAGRGC